MPIFKLIVQRISMVGGEYRGCFRVKLNGKYPIVISAEKALYWKSFREISESLKETKMLIRH